MLAFVSTRKIKMGASAFTILVSARIDRKFPSPRQFQDKILIGLVQPRHIANHVVFVFPCSLSRRLSFLSLHGYGVWVKFLYGSWAISLLGSFVSGRCWALYFTTSSNTLPKSSLGPSWVINLAHFIFKYHRRRPSNNIPL